MSYSSSTVGVNVSLVTGLGVGGDAQGDVIVLNTVENLTGSGLWRHANRRCQCELPDGWCGQ